MNEETPIGLFGSVLPPRATPLESQVWSRRHTLSYFLSIRVDEPVTRGQQVRLSVTCASFPRPLCPAQGGAGRPASAVSPARARGPPGAAPCLPVCPPCCATCLRCTPSLIMPQRPPAILLCPRSDRTLSPGELQVLPSSHSPSLPPPGSPRASSSKDFVHTLCVSS